MTLHSDQRLAAHSPKNPHNLYHATHGSQDRNEEGVLHSDCIAPSSSAVHEAIELAFGGTDDRARSHIHR